MVLESRRQVLWALGFAGLGILRSRTLVRSAACRSTITSFLQVEGGERDVAAGSADSVAKDGSRRRAAVGVPLPDGWSSSARSAKSCEPEDPQDLTQRLCACVGAEAARKAETNGNREGATGEKRVGHRAACYHRDARDWQRAEAIVDPVGVHKLDLPCNKANSAATADITMHGTDEAEKLSGRSS
jgi:hypothetical protein